MKLLITKKSIISYISIILLITCFACTKYSTFKPISPQKTVQDLTPTLNWNAPEPDSVVDLAIWEGVRKENDHLYIPGPLVYHKENISGDSHTVEQKLKPNCRYLWSVKKNSTNTWATAKKPTIPIPGLMALYIADILSEDMERSGFFFEFETSDK